MPNVTNFCFTLNNYTENDISLLRANQVGSRPEFRYCIMGREVASTGTPHLQGFIVFSERRSQKTALEAFKRMLGHSRAHVSSCRGDAKSNIEYCSKSDPDPISIGELPRGVSSSRPDNSERYKAAISSAKLNKLTELESSEPSMLVRHYRTFKAIRDDALNVPNSKVLPKPCGVIYWGETGTGKTFTARQETSLYVKDKTNKWFDGYAGEKCVLIDDVDLDWVSKNWSFCLNLLDSYPLKVEVKGGSYQVRPEKVILTSNNSLDELVAAVPYAQQQAFRRRFVEETQFPLPLPPPPLNDDDGGFIREDEDFVPCTPGQEEIIELE